eukprot:g14746.t1
MKFVALLSGGKDSCYNSMECVRHGHELVCLANLYPPAAVSDEADSFMYQSAAHTAIEAQAECFGKPLIRRQLTGRAVNQSLQYRPTEEDEVEDLFLLLKDVKERFPEVTGVGSGAILSNYQRTRVENVCGRLGLTSLAYLWRRPQSPLLGEMVEAGLDAVLVKVASFGLHPEKHLGRSLAHLRPFFESLHSRCGFHVCGEGGEYETLTLDCPLFVRKLVLDDTVVVTHSDDMFAPVGLLRVIKCHTESKPPLAVAPCAAVAGGTSNRDHKGAENSELRGIGGDSADPQAEGVVVSSAEAAVAAVAPPEAVGRDFDTSQPKGWVGRGTSSGGSKEGQGSMAVASPSPSLCCLPHVHEGSGGLVYLSGIRTSQRFAEAEAAVAAVEVAARQTADCLALALAGLEEVGVSFRDVCFVHLYLRDMEHFFAVNEEYCKWFQGENPPSRSCVAVPLPPACSVMLDMVALRGSGEALSKDGAACTQRQALHVRSISSWAPVCIGPYCQANTLGPGGGIALIAGQIGLQPTSMTFPARIALPSSSSRDSSSEGERRAMMVHEQEMALCVSHASSVASAVSASVSRGCVFTTLYISQEAAAAAAAAAAAVSSAASHETGDNTTSVRGASWMQGMIDECRVLMEARLAQEQAEAAAEAAGTGAAGEGDDDSAEDGWNSDPEELAKEAARKMVLVRPVPFLAVVVPSLPRNATVELEVICMSRAALSALPCRYYPPSSSTKILTAYSFATSKGQTHPVPARFIPVSGSSSSASGNHIYDAADEVGATRENATAVAAHVTTTGSTVDRILGVAASSLSITGHNGSNTSAAVAHGQAGASAWSITGGATTSTYPANRTGYTEAAENSATSRPIPPATSNATLPVRILSATQLEEAMSLVLAGAFDAVSAARLRWRDVACLRVYYFCRTTTSAGNDAALEPAWTDGGGVDEELLKRATFLAIAGATRERPAVSFVPVSELQDGAVISVHATAWSLDRLRTELWVRGAP